MPPDQARTTTFLPIPNSEEASFPTADMIGAWPSRRYAHIMRAIAQRRLAALGRRRGPGSRAAHACGARPSRPAAQDPRSSPWPRRRNGLVQIRPTALARCGTSLRRTKATTAHRCSGGGARTPAGAARSGAGCVQPEGRKRGSELASPTIRHISGIRRDVDDTTEADTANLTYCNLLRNARS